VAGTRGRRLSLGATFGAIGIVYGDIGTSPLYALEQSLNATGQGSHPATVLLGVLSLMFWSLLAIVTIKYVTLMMRADNEGEGGILSLFALVQRRLEDAPRWGRAVIGLAVMGAALFYCDALITPAISVLGAVEGLELLNADMARVVVPLTLVIIMLLFAIQRSGTERVGRLFAPIMLLWFAVLAYTGGVAIVKNPQVLRALDPRLGLMLLVQHQGVALAILGSVFLTVTGGEALYADMGSFGTPVFRNRLSRWIDDVFSLCPGNCQLAACSNIPGCLGQFPLEQYHRRRPGFSRHVGRQTEVGG
jgi:KUP system potassium uptake protein